MQQHINKPYPIIFDLFIIRKHLGIAALIATLKSIQFLIKKKHQIRKHSKAEDKCFHECVVCNFKTIYKTYLNDHMNSVHSTIRTFSCNICGLKFALKGGLNAHLKTVHTSVSNIFTCYFCQKQFNMKHYLNAHLKMVHTASAYDAFKCELCPKQFCLERYLIGHVERVHTSPSDFIF
jgi:uncharacterized Zn-finger protein